MGIWKVLQSSSVNVNTEGEPRKCLHYAKFTITEFALKVWKSHFTVFFVALLCAYAVLFVYVHSFSNNFTKTRQQDPTCTVLCMRKEILTTITINLHCTVSDYFLWKKSEIFFCVFVFSASSMQKSSTFCKLDQTALGCLSLLWM